MIMFLTTLQIPNRIFIFNGEKLVKYYKRMLTVTSLRSLRWPFAFSFVVVVVVVAAVVVILFVCSFVLFCFACGQPIKTNNIIYIVMSVT